MQSAESSSTFKLRQQSLENFDHVHGRSIVENAEFKIGKSFEENEKRSASLKVLPRGFKEFQMWGEVRASSKKIEEASALLQLNQTRFDRASHYLDFWHLTQKQKLLTQKLELAKNALEIYRIATRGGVADTKDVLRAQQEYEIAKMNLESQKDQQDLVWEKMRLVDESLSSTQMIPEKLSEVTQITQLIRSFQSEVDNLGDQSLQAHKARIARMKAQNSQMDIDMEISKRQKTIESLELKMTEDRREKVYSVELGFNLPGFSQDPGVQEKRRKIIETEIDAHSVEKDFIIQSRLMVMNLKQSLKKLENLVASSTDEQRKKLRRISRKQDPLFQLTLEKEYLDSQVTQQDQIYLTLQNYFLAYNHFEKFIEKVPDNLWQKSADTGKAL